MDRRVKKKKGLWISESQQVKNSHAFSFYKIQGLTRDLSQTNGPIHKMAYKNHFIS